MKLLFIKKDVFQFSVLSSSSLTSSLDGKTMSHSDELLLAVALARSPCSSYDCLFALPLTTSYLATLLPPRLDDLKNENACKQFPHSGFSFVSVSGMEVPRWNMRWKTVFTFYLHSTRLTIFTFFFHLFSLTFRVTLQQTFVSISFFFTFLSDSPGIDVT